MIEERQVPEMYGFIDKHINNNRPWSESEEQFLIDNYGQISTHEIAKQLGRTYNSVNKKASVMGLKFHPSTD